MQDGAPTTERSEGVSYYNFMADLGVPYFHWGGTQATERLLSLCQMARKRNSWSSGADRDTAHAAPQENMVAR